MIKNEKVILYNYYPVKQRIKSLFDSVTMSEMFEEEVFILKCYADLCTKKYVDYEDVKTDIGMFVEDNLPSELKSISYIRHLCIRILAEYIEYDSESMSSVEEPDDEDDDILYRSVEIWLAASETLV